MRKQPLWVLASVALLACACASSPEVKSQAYAELKSDRVFEYELPAVWKGIESALRNHKVVDRDPEEVDSVEMKRISERSLETDWIYGQSRDKYHEYKVNGSPRKKYLQVRYRYKVEAKKHLGGTEVVVRADEEIEKLKDDGAPDGYEGVGKPDPTRGSDLLEKINLAILGGSGGP